MPTPGSIHSGKYGLHRIVPDEGAPDSTTIDIIAIHGLDTDAARTWNFDGRNGNPVVNWLKDGHMLPAALPQAAIFTYDWNANAFRDAPVQTLLSHADNLLALIDQKRGSASRPIIFIASCFGGLILAKALTRAAQYGSCFQNILLDVAGVVFLATPFRGSDGADEAKWVAVVGGIMGEHTSRHLIDDLQRKDKELRALKQEFTELTRPDAASLSIHCFFETEHTKLLKKFLSSSWANALSNKWTNKLLVSEDSACIDTFQRHGLAANHTLMNKFDGPGNSNYKLVLSAISRFANSATHTIAHRKNLKRNAHFVVPFGRNKNFVGRESILENILNMIPPSAAKDDCQRIVINGLGGIGKTHLAIEAAYRIRDKYPYCSVFWVPVVDATTFENAYREIGKRLKVPGIGDDNADVKALVQVALGQDEVSDWLLILDNADDRKLLFEDVALIKYLPFNRKGSIFITTRTDGVATKLVGHGTKFSLEAMSNTEATRLLHTGLQANQIGDFKDTTKLLEILINLPLAIRQASAYMAETKDSIAAYLSYCQSDNELFDILNEEFQDVDRYPNIQNPVAKTWLISFDHILRDMPLAGSYLKFICYLSEKDIPKFLLPSGNTMREENKAIATLQGYAFITERADQSSFDIHRLVRLVTQKWVKAIGEQGKCITSLIRQLSERLPWPKHENREDWARYLPHAEKALEVRGEYINNDKALWFLLINVGRSNSLFGKYSQAEALNREALLLATEALGNKHPDTLNSLNSLAQALQYQGRYEEAEQMYRQGLQRSTQVLGSEHPDTLTGLNNLAITLRCQGKYEEAEQMHRQGLERSTQVHGPEHPSTLTSLNNLATALQCQGKYKEAEQMHRQALEQKTRMLGPKHPDTLISQINLANNLHYQGRYEEAEQMHRQGLERSTQVLKPEHPVTLASLNNLAIALQCQGKYEEAEQMHRKGLQQSTQVLGPEHPNTLASLNNLAEALQNHGRYEEAEQMHRQGLELSTQVLGPKHPYTLASLINLANNLRYQGRYEEAEQMHRQGLELRTQVLGSEHPDTLASLNNLANTLHNQQKYEEAEQMHRQGIERRTQVLGSEHPDTLASLNNLAITLRCQGKYEEAEQMHRQVFKWRTRMLGSEHPSALTSLNNLATTFQCQGKYEEAEQMHRQGLERRTQVLGSEHPDTFASLNNLAQALQNQGKYEEAEQMHRQGLELSTQVLGPKHPDTLTSLNNLANTLRKQRKYEDAEKIDRQARERRTQVLEPEHPSTLANLATVAITLRDQGKYEESEQKY